MNSSIPLSLSVIAHKVMPPLNGKPSLIACPGINLDHIEPELPLLPPGPQVLVTNRHGKQVGQNKSTCSS